MGINYTAESSEKKVDQLFTDEDGKLVSDLDGVGFSVTLSMLYQFSDRTLAMRLDEVWCVGAGLTYELMEGRSVDFNANLLLLGNGRVDQTSGLLGQRRVAGESTDPYAVTVEMAYHF